MPRLTAFKPRLHQVKCCPATCCLV